MKVAEQTEVFEIVIQEARMALQRAGWFPLVHIGAAEHWVRDNQRCIIYCEGDDFKEVVCDKENLKRVAFVNFVRLNDGTLITQ